MKRIFKKITSLFRKIYQKIRAFKYILFSNNIPVLIDCKINIPIQFCGMGSIIINRSTIGVWPSPYFITTYSYFEARGENACIKIGKNTFINNNATIIADKTNIHIGENCLIGFNFSVFDSDFHGIRVSDRLNGNYICKEVIIGDNVFIGSSVTVLKGVTIGNNAVIGAGSVVVKDVEENAIYAGNPARFIKKIIN